MVVIAFMSPRVPCTVMRHISKKSVGTDEIKREGAAVVYEQVHGRLTRE